MRDAQSMERKSEAMTARVLDGTKIRDAVFAELSGEIAGLAAEGVRPGLAAVLVGENPASQLYVKSKIAACEQIGLASWMYTPSANISTEELLKLVEKLNADDAVDGILVQLPLPPQVEANIGGSRSGERCGRISSGESRQAGERATWIGGMHASWVHGNSAARRSEDRRRQRGGAGAQRHCGQADGAAPDACECDGDDLSFEDA
jgi:hypothetical protein